MMTYPDDADGAVLADLAARGVDMAQPLLIEFPVTAPDEAAANAIASALAMAGYDCQIEYDEGEPAEDGEFDSDEEAEEFAAGWDVYATRRMIPDYHEINRVQSDLDRIARPLGGKSDGWGVLLDDDGEA